MIKKIESIILRLQQIRKKNLENHLDILFNQAHGEWISREYRHRYKEKYNYLLNHYQTKYNERFIPNKPRSYRGKP